MGIEIDPVQVSRARRHALRHELRALGLPVRLVGLLATDARPSRVYARYTARAAEEVGVAFELRRVDRHALEAAIEEANEDPDVHGIMVYYPVFGVARDHSLKDLVAPLKDVEGLHARWAHELYRETRGQRPAAGGVEGPPAPLVPCTPQAILALLDAAGVDRRGREVVIFNRSEVVGRPLAALAARQGARVISFDEDGAVEVVGARWRDLETSRSRALSRADVVITGVPSARFPLIEAHEVRPQAVGVNFSTRRNFTPEAAAKVRVWIPRVGPMTVTMALANALRLRRAQAVAAGWGGAS